MNTSTPAENLARAIVPKSDQLNGDDLIIGPITVRIRKMEVRGQGEQRVSVFYDGDNDKPYKPNKSMCRVMVAVWGNDPMKYVGKWMTLYRDPKVKWGGLEVGGIRISHMTDIQDQLVMALTETKGSKKPFVVKPMKTPASGHAAAEAEMNVDDLKNGIETEAKKGTDPLRAAWQKLGGANQKLLGEAFLNEMKAVAAKTAEGGVDFA